MSRRHSPAVYRRRRILVLGVVVLLAGGGYWAISAVVGDAPAQPKASAPSSASATAPPTVAATDGPLAVALGLGAAACAPESIRITPHVEDQTAGGPVGIELVVSTSAAKPCRFIPGESDVIVVISRGDDVVYDSTLCKEVLPLEPLALSPRWATQVATQWSGRGSTRDCAGPAFVGPQTYQLQIGTLGGEPGKDTFVLRPAPTPSPTAAAAAEPSGEPAH